MVVVVLPGLLCVFGDRYVFQLAYINIHIWQWIQGYDSGSGTLSLSEYTALVHLLEPCHFHLHN